MFKSINFIGLALITCFFLGCSQQSVPQYSADIERLIEGKRFLFVANSATAMRGGTRFLNGNADLTIKHDTLVSYLPYYGVANSVPVTTEDGGIRFTSYNADYSILKNKKGYYEFTINIPDNANTNRMLLIINPGGSATLDVRSKFRDAISFQGNIRPIR